jgi:hypothetical protein
MVHPHTVDDGCVNVAFKPLASLSQLGNRDDAIRHVLLGISNYFPHTQRQSHPPQRATVTFDS